MQKTKYQLTFAQLKEIVETDEKGRYVFNDGFTKIKAAQGHSININLNLKSIEPPFVLFHGTSNVSIQNIKKQGIKKMNRQYVHLSKDEKTAMTVGMRHGFPVILKIKANAMYNDGLKFYLSENGVWLTEHIPVKYIIF